MPEYEVAPEVKPTQVTDEAIRKERETEFIKPGQDDNRLARGGSVGKCKGRQEYMDWIDKLFNLAPPAPSCAVVSSFCRHTMIQRTTILFRVH